MSLRFPKKRVHLAWICSSTNRGQGGFRESLINLLTVCNSWRGLRTRREIKGQRLVWDTRVVEKIRSGSSIQDGKIARRTRESRGNIHLRETKSWIFSESIFRSFILVDSSPSRFLPLEVNGSGYVIYLTNFLSLFRFLFLYKVLQNVFFKNIFCI